MTSTAAASRRRADRHGSRRWRVVLGIALVEGVIVGLSPDVSRWTVVALAAAAFALYVTVGRSTRWQTGHELVWIFACSQALAVVIAVLSFFFSWLAYVAAAVLAVAALALLAVRR